MEQTLSKDVQEKLDMINWDSLKDKYGISRDSFYTNPHLASQLAYGRMTDLVFAGKDDFSGMLSLRANMDTSGEKPEMKVKAVFELRAACLAGFMPDLFGCHICGCQNPDRFDLSEGMLECVSCRGMGGGIRMPVNPGVLDAMRYICFCDPKKILSFDIKTENLMKLADITEAYLTTQLERGFSTLDFYKSLMI